MKIILDHPGEGFSGAFLTGNGHMGQTLCFEENVQRIGLSHITFFSGKREAPEEKPVAQAEAFGMMRRAAAEGDYEAAERAAEGFIGKKGNYGTHLPAGSVAVSFDRTGPLRAYSRCLDTVSGIASCDMTLGDCRIRETAFCSHPDRVFCLRIECGRECAVSVAAQDMGRTQNAGRDILFEKQALETRHSDGECGVWLYGRLRVLGGRCESRESGLRILFRGECVVLIAMETDYSLPGGEACRRAAADTLDRAEAAGFDALYRRHTEDFSAAMNRAKLDLPGDRDTQLMFEFGKYLAFSASREDSPCAMSLQGLWNDGVACRIGWTCDMHLDINTQMNHWLCGPGRLPESRAPLLKWMEDALIPAGEKAASVFYGLEGWCAEIVSNIWGFAQPYWDRSLSPCPACGAWIAEEFAEHWRFTAEEKQRERAERALRGAVEFFLGYLFRDGNGALHWGPSITPENGFVSGGKKRFAAPDMPFEGAVIRGLLRSCIEVSADKDDPLAERARKTLEEMPPAQRSGEEMSEFPYPLTASDPQHRHMSHLAGLFPYGEITPEKTPELARACERSIARRLTPYEKWEDTGWSRSMLILYEARLMNGEKALFHIREMKRGLLEKNRLVMHPSTRGAPSFKPVWELDGNTGLASGVAEMLLQSHDGVISLLPALPTEWASGSFEGFGARGGFAVDCAWKDGRAVEAAVRNIGEKAAEARLRYGGTETEVFLEAGEKRRFTFG